MNYYYNINYLHKALYVILGGGTMDVKMREKINEFADAVRETFEISSPVENMDEIIMQIGGTINVALFLPEFADGKIERSGDGFIITIPLFQNENRKRFSIAHELGHLFIHMGYLTDEETWQLNENNVYLRKEIGEMEYQANEFAAAFLMPKKEFIKKMQENCLDGGYDIEKVAEFFKVSLDAAITRARWLNLISWGSL